MKRLFYCLATLLGASGVLLAQPLPKVQLLPAYAAVQLDRPLWMAEPPDGSGRVFLVEQAGRILITSKGSDGSKTREFLNIVDRHPFGDNEEGLLSMAFHPGFASNGLFYIYYNQHHANKFSPYMRQSVISEFKVSTDDTNRADMSSERILLEVPQPFGNHKGGEINFGPDGYLYIGLGDGGMATDPYNSGQNSAALLGKILRIDVNTRASGNSGRDKVTLPYGYPPDNPYIHEPAMGGLGARKEVYALGLRNPWRYSWDRQTGDLWVGDVGQDLWEEVDLVVKGGNYGWNVREGFHHFKPGPPGAQYLDPVIEYPHRADMLSQSPFSKHSPGSCVVGGYVYRGQKYPALQGIYIYADYTLGTVFGLRERDGKATDYGTMLDQPKNIASFAEDKEGEIYVLTLDGHIFSIASAE